MKGKKMAVYTKAEKAVFEADEKGKFIAFLLGLKQKSGRYETEWGSKTPTGLYNCMVRITQTHSEDLGI